MEGEYSDTKNNANVRNTSCCVEVALSSEEPCLDTRIIATTKYCRNGNREIALAAIRYFSMLLHSVRRRSHNFISSIVYTTS